MPSTVISSFHYDKAKRELTVIFISGTVYIYKKVPEDVYEEMKNASSKGIFLNRHIKGAYKFEKKA